MKNYRQLILSLLAAVALTVPAQATQIDFAGSYNLSDSGDAGTIRESFTFTSGFIFSTDPAIDPINLQLVGIGALTLDESTITPTSASFSPNTYAGGFVVPGFFVADLTAVTLDIMGGSGVINPFLTLNLSNIVPDGGYTAGTSPIADAFINAGLGASIMTVQISLAQGG